LDTFKEAGWEPAWTLDTSTIFKAKRGTTPIYSDKNTLAEKYYEQGKPTYKAFLIFSLLGVLFGGLNFWLEDSNAHDWILNTIYIGSLISWGLASPLGFMTLAFKLKERGKSPFIVSVFIYLALIIAVASWFL